MSAMGEGGRNMARAFCLLIILAFISTGIGADTYSRYSGGKYFSRNGRSELVIDSVLVARLYITGKSRRLAWTRHLSFPPAWVFIPNSGDRVVLFENGYGNDRKTESQALTILDERGKDLKKYLIKDFSQLENVPVSISASYWFGFVGIDLSERLFVVQTVRNMLDSESLCAGERTQAQLYQCRGVIPVKQFVILLESGEIIDKFQLERIR